MKKLRIAILGQGRSGRNIHGAYLKGDERFEIAAVVDPLPERRERARAEYGIESVFASHTALYGQSGIDLVVNATPSPLHFSYALELMENGFNVLQEKPLAATSAQVGELRLCMERTGRTLAIFLQSRYAPQFEQVRSVAESGVLGRLVCVKIAVSGFSRRWDWQTLQENVAGSLYNTGPHPVGQALALMNSEATPSVFCHMDRANTFGDAEDFVKLILTAPGCPMADVEISSCDAFPAYTFVIQGERGTLFAAGDEIKWKYFKLEEAPEQRLITAPLSGEDGLPAYCGERLAWYEERAAAANVTDNVCSYATQKL